MGETRGREKCFNKSEGEERKREGLSGGGKGEEIIPMKAVIGKERGVWTVKGSSEG